MKLKCLFILSFALTACSSMLYKEFDKVELGMDRSEVISLVGSPLRVHQHNQPHKWIYRFYNEEKNEVFREVQFEAGKVIYAGPQVTKERILFPTGSSYTQKDLEDYLKQEKAKLETGTANTTESPDSENSNSKADQKASESQKQSPDQAAMEAEILRDLKPQNNFQPLPTETAPATNSPNAAPPTP